MKPLFVLCCFVLPLSHLRAQCTLPTGVPASGACPTTGTVVTSALSGTTLAAATTYYYTSGTPLTLISVTIKGILYVCGNLTINTLSFSGTPTIVVEPGGSLTIYTGTIKGSITNYGILSVLNGANQVTIDGQIANYGTMTFGDTGANIGTGIQGNSGYLIYNGVGATFTVEGNSLNNAAITNMGQMYFNNNLNQQTASICEGNAAEITVEQFNDDTSPGITLDAPGDKVGLVVTTDLGGSSSNGTLASSANVFICEAPGITIGSPYLPGSATVETNCTSLAGILAVQLESFTIGTGPGNTGVLEWTTAGEEGLSNFVLASSRDAKTFLPIDTIPAHGTPSTYSDPVSLEPGTTWFRLQLDNTLGDAMAYSSVVQAEATGGSDYLRVEPNLISDQSLQVQARVVLAQTGTWVVIDMMGRMVFKQQASLSAGVNTTVLSLPGLASGVYELVLEGAAISVPPVRFVIAR